MKRTVGQKTALTKVFGAYDEPDNCLFAYIIVVMNKISASDKFTSDIRYRSRNLKDSLLKYETVVTTHIFLKIFKYTTPLSKYLQTKGMNVVQMYKMVQSYNSYSSK